MKTCFRRLFPPAAALVLALAGLLLLPTPGRAQFGKGMSFTPGLGAQALQSMPGGQFNYYPMMFSPMMGGMMGMGGGMMGMGGGMMGMMGGMMGMGGGMMGMMGGGMMGMGGGMMGMGGGMMGMMGMGGKMMGFNGGSGQ
jgi:hypothetical protein